MTAQLNEYEWETEYEDEYEGEWESEYEAEYESEWEAEWESEFEGEGEAFFGRLASIAQRATPALRRIGLQAARSALGHAGRAGAALGGAISPGGARAGQLIGSHLGSLLSNLLPQREYEGEGEFEDEYEINPIARIYPDVLMEHLGHAATQTESEAEAEAFVGALVPLAVRAAPQVARAATRLAPQAARAVARVTPQLTRGLTNVARTLRRSPATRQLVRTLPAIARQTVGTLARQAAAGQPVTPARAAQTLARQTAQVISSPQRCVQIYRRSRAMDQRYHQAASANAPAARPAQAARSSCPHCGAREY